MNYLTPLIPFLAGWIVLLLSPTLSWVALVNGIAQLVLFFFVVNLPIKKTGRMSYVDIGWPLGVAVIGAVTLLLSEGYRPRVLLVSGVYLFIGLRMGLGALYMWRLGRLKVEFPRYDYQKLRWQRAGKTNVPLATQVEASMQGLASASEALTEPVAATRLAAPFPWPFRGTGRGVVRPSPLMIMTLAVPPARGLSTQFHSLRGR